MPTPTANSFDTPTPKVVQLDAPQPTVLAVPKLDAPKPKASGSLS